MIRKLQALQGYKIDDEDHLGITDRQRGETIDDISAQAAAMMRLNSLWGLEPKGKTKDLRKAEPTEPDAI